MVRKLVIALAAALVVAAGSPLTAPASVVGVETN
jgi:hypothetical protein